MQATPDVARATPTSARRRRERRIRSFFRHERMTVQMAVISAQHHSAQRCCSVATQTDDEVPAATFAATASPAATYTATPASAPVVTHAAPSPVFEYVAPARVIQNIAPVPTVIFDAPSKQLPPVYTTATVATDDNLDVTSLVNPQFSSTAVEGFAPQVVGSLPPLEEFTEPVYNQVHEELFVTGEMTLNIVEHPAVQEQVIVQEIAEVVNSLLPVEEFTEPVYNQVHHEQIVAGEMTEQIIVQELPPVVEQIQEHETSSTSTNSSSTSTIRDDIAVNMEKEVERAAMLTKRMIQTPLPEPPMVEPPLPEPPMMEPDRTSAKRRRRTRYTPLPVIMEHAVYLAPNAWQPIRHA